MPHVDFESPASEFGRLSTSRLRLQTTANGIRVPICELSLNPENDFTPQGSCFSCDPTAKFSDAYTIDRTRSEGVHPSTDAVGGLYFSDIDPVWGKERVTYVEMMALDDLPELINVWASVQPCQWNSEFIELKRATIVDELAADPTDCFDIASDSTWLLEPPNGTAGFDMQARQSQISGYQFQRWHAAIGGFPIGTEPVRSRVGLGYFALTWIRRGGNHVLGPVNSIGQGGGEFSIDAPDAAVAWQNNLPLLLTDNATVDVECGNPSTFVDNDTNTLSLTAS